MAAPPPDARAARAARFGIDCGDGVRFAAGSWAVGGEYVQRLPLQNVTGRSLHLRYTLPRHRVFYMAYPDPLVLPPGVTTYLEVRFRPVAYARLEDAIVCGCETGTFSVPLTADVATLAVDVPARVDFGFVPVAEATSAALRLTNVGQLDAAFEVEAPAPFTVAPARGLLRVGCTLPLDVTVLPGAAHKLRGAARVTLSACAPAADGGAAVGGGGGGGVGSGASGGMLVTKDVALTAHAKYQHICLVVGAAGGDGSATGRRAETQRGGVLPEDHAAGRQGSGGAVAAASTVPAPTPGGHSGSDGGGGGGGDDDGATTPGPPPGSASGPLLLQWGLVEVDCGADTVTGPAISGTSESSAQRRSLRRVVTVVNSGPVGATVSAQRLWAGSADDEGEAGTTGGGGSVDGSPPPPPFSVFPLTAWLPPGASTALTFSFHPHAPLCTPRRTPLLAHFALSVPGGNVLHVTTMAVPGGPCVTIARKTRGAASPAAVGGGADSGAAAPLPGGSGGGSSSRTRRPTTAAAPPPSDVAAGTRATVGFGDVPVGAPPRTQVLVLTNHSAVVPAHWAVADCEAGCGVFLLSRVAGILPPAASSALVVTFAPPLPGGYHRRLVFLVRDGDPVCADVTGTAFTADQRPAPLRQWHVERARRLPARLHWMGTDECEAALQALRCAAAEAAGDAARFATAGDHAALRALALAASAEAERGLAALPSPSGDRARGGTAQLQDLFDASAVHPATEAPGVVVAAAAAASSAAGPRQRTPAHLRHHPVGLSLDAPPPTSPTPHRLYHHPPPLPSSSSSLLPQPPPQPPPQPLSALATRGSAPSAAWAPLDFGCVPRTSPPKRLTVWVTNTGAARVTVTWVVPVPPAVLAGQPRLGATLLALPSTTTALLRLPADSSGGGGGVGGGGGALRDDTYASTAIVKRDWVVSPECADVEPGGGATPFTVAFRPGQDARFYSAVLEAHVAPKVNRSFRLVEPCALLPPVCLPLRVVGHTFSHGMGRWIPRLETSYGGSATTQRLVLPPWLVVPARGVGGVGGGEAADTVDGGGDGDRGVVAPQFYTFQLANAGDVPVAFTITTPPPPTQPPLSRSGRRDSEVLDSLLPELTFNPSGGVIQRNSFALVTLRLALPPPAPSAEPTGRPAPAVWRVRLPMVLSLNGVPEYTITTTVVATLVAGPALELLPDCPTDSEAVLGPLATRAGCITSGTCASSDLLRAGATRSTGGNGAGGGQPSSSGAPPLRLYIKPASVGVSSSRRVWLRNASPVPLSYRIVPQAALGGDTCESDRDRQAAPHAMAVDMGQHGRHAPAPDGVFGPLHVSPAAGDIPAGGIQVVICTYTPTHTGRLECALSLLVTLLRGCETEPLSAAHASLSTSSAAPIGVATAGSAGVAFVPPQRRRFDSATGLQIRDTGEGRAIGGSAGELAAGHAGDADAAGGRNGRAAAVISGAPLDFDDSAAQLPLDSELDGEWAAEGACAGGLSSASPRVQARLPPDPLAAAYAPVLAMEHTSGRRCVGGSTVVQSVALLVESEATSGALQFSCSHSSHQAHAAHAADSVDSGEAAAASCIFGASDGRSTLQAARCAGEGPGEHAAVAVGGVAQLVLTLTNTSDCTLPFELDAACGLTLDPAVLEVAASCCRGDSDVLLGPPRETSASVLTEAAIEQAFQLLCGPLYRGGGGGVYGVGPTLLPGGLLSPWTRLLFDSLQECAGVGTTATADGGGGNGRCAPPLPTSSYVSAVPPVLSFSPSRGHLDARARVAVTVTFRPPCSGHFRFGVYCRSSESSPARPRLDGEAACRRGSLPLPGLSGAGGDAEEGAGASSPSSQLAAIAVALCHRESRGGGDRSDGYGGDSRRPSTCGDRSGGAIRPTATTSGSERAVWLLTGTGSHPTLAVEAVAQLTSREMLLSLFPFHAAVDQRGASTGCDDDVMLHHRPSAHSGDAGGDRTTGATADVPGAPPSSAGPLVSLASLRAAEGGDVGGRPRRRRRQGSVGSSSSRMLGGGGLPGDVGATVSAACASGTRALSTIAARSTSGSGSGSGSGRRSSRAGLAEAAMALGISPLLASLLEANAAAVAAAPSASAASAPCVTCTPPRSASPALSLLHPPQTTPPGLDAELPRPLPWDPRGWMRPLAFARSGVKEGVAEPVDAAEPAPGQRAGAPRDPTRDWLFALPPVEGDPSAAAVSSIPASTPHLSPLPTAYWWSLLRLRELNRELFVGPQLRPLARALATTSTPPVRLWPAGDHHHDGQEWRFPPSPAGSPPCVLLLRLCNPGALPVTLDALWPGDEEGKLGDVEPWVTAGDGDGSDPGRDPRPPAAEPRVAAAREGRAGGAANHASTRGTRSASASASTTFSPPASPSSSALELKSLLDRRVFGMAPRSVTLAPGAAAHVRVHYAYVAPGDHVMLLALRVRGAAAPTDGRAAGGVGPAWSLPLRLHGSTLGASEAALYWPVPDAWCRAGGRRVGSRDVSGGGCVQLQQVELGAGGATSGDLASGPPLPLPQLQPLPPLINPSRAPVRWRLTVIDEQPASARHAPGAAPLTSPASAGAAPLAAGPPPPLAVFPASGLLPPGSSVALTAACCPMEPRMYRARLALSFEAAEASPAGACAAGSSASGEGSPHSASGTHELAVQFTAELPARASHGSPAASSGGSAHLPLLEPSSRCASESLRASWAAHAAEEALTALAAASATPGVFSMDDTHFRGVDSVALAAATAEAARVHAVLYPTQHAPPGSAHEAVSTGLELPPSRTLLPPTPAPLRAEPPARAASLTGVSAAGCSFTGARPPLLLDGGPAPLLPLHADAPESFAALVPAWCEFRAPPLRLVDAGGTPPLPPPPMQPFSSGSGGWLHAIAPPPVLAGALRPVRPQSPPAMHRLVTLRNTRGAVALLLTDAASERPAPVTAAAAPSVEPTSSPRGPGMVGWAGGSGWAPAASSPAGLADPGGAGSLWFRWELGPASSAGGAPSTDSSAAPAAVQLLCSGALSVSPLSGELPVGGAARLRVTLRPSLLPPGTRLVDVHLPCLVGAPAPEVAARCAGGGGAGGAGGGASVSGGGGGSSVVHTTDASEGGPLQQFPAAWRLLQSAGGGGRPPPGVMGALRRHVPLASRSTTAAAAKQRPRQQQRSGLPLEREARSSPPPVPSTPPPPPHPAPPGQPRATTTTGTGSSPSWMPFAQGGAGGVLASGGLPTGGLTMTRVPPSPRAPQQQPAATSATAAATAVAAAAAAAAAATAAAPAAAARVAPSSSMHPLPSRLVRAGSSTLLRGDCGGGDTPAAAAGPAATAPAPHHVPPPVRDGARAECDGADGGPPPPPPPPPLVWTRLWLRVTCALGEADAPLPAAAAAVAVAPAACGPPTAPSATPSPPVTFAGALLQELAHRLAALA